MQAHVLTLQAYYLSEVTLHYMLMIILGLKALTDLVCEEITDVLGRTGATAYWDRTAAVKYLPYGKNSWIS